MPLLESIRGEMEVVLETPPIRILETGDSCYNCTIGVELYHRQKMVCWQWKREIRLYAGSVESV